ncbi:MAG: HAD family hydrolase [Deinococcales bacterium]
MIRALCFDLDGTLGGYAGDFRSFLALLRHELLLHDCDLNRFVEVVQDELSRDGPLTLEHALRRALARLDQRAPADLAAMTEAALRAYAEDVRPAPGAGALLERLHRRGVPMALVSNGPVDMQRAALAGLKFETYFRSVLVSGDPDVAARKPAPRIFSLACTGLEALPSETAMIGDSAASDVEGALAYGMQAILFGSAAEGERLGVPAAADVEALAALLEERLAS